MSRLIANRVKCLHCGDIIESVYRHHFVRCSCGDVFVDGGTFYQRIGFTEASLFEDLSVWEEEHDSPDKTEAQVSMEAP